MVVYQKTEEDFEETYSKLKDTYSPGQDRLLEYLNEHEGHQHAIHQITISTLRSERDVIPIDDSTLQATSQEQENEDLDDQLLAEMGVSSSQAVQVTEVTQVNLMSGIQAAHPPATTPAAAAPAAAAELAGQQPKKRCRPKG
ncbi:hypothetical protein V8E54_010696 [Elaphomyces granulatus]